MIAKFKQTLLTCKVASIILIHIAFLMISVLYFLFFFVHNAYSLLFWLQVFRKDNRTMLDRKDLFKTTLRKAAYAFKRISELNLTCRFLTKVLKLFHVLKLRRVMLLFSVFISYIGITVIL